MQYNYSPVQPYGGSGSVLVLNPTDRSVIAQSGLPPAALRDYSTLRGLVVGSGPTLASTAPATAVHGAGNTSVVCTGTGFVNGCYVLFNGQGLTTTFTSGTSVSGTILAAQLVTAGTASVQVLNPDPRPAHALWPATE
jgi:hypothetical protein